MLTLNLSNILPNPTPLSVTCASASENNIRVRLINNFQLLITCSNINIK